MKGSEYQLSGAAGNTYWLVPAVALPTIIALTATVGWVDANSRDDNEIAPVVDGLFLVAFVGLLYWLFRRARCRSASAALRVSLGLACFTWYSGWVWFEVFLLPDASQGSNALVRYATRFARPDLVWTDARAINAQGMHVVDKNGKQKFVNSGNLWLFWSVEAAVTVALIPWLLGSCVNEDPFCERCGRWTKLWQNFHFLCPQNDTLRAQALGGDLDAVLALPPEPTRAIHPRWKLDLHVCPKCLLTATWRIVQVDTVSVRGVAMDNDKEISPYFVLPPNGLARFQSGNPPAA